MLKELNILKPISQSKADVVPLQAADILAHQMARRVLMTQKGAKPGLRDYTEQLCKVPGMPQYINKADLSRLYSEEVYLEQMRALGKFPKRVINFDAI